MNIVVAMLKISDGITQILTAEKLAGLAPEDAATILESCGAELRDETSEIGKLFRERIEETE